MKRSTRDITVDLYVLGKPGELLKRDHLIPAQLLIVEEAGTWRAGENGQSDTIMVRGKVGGTLVTCTLALDALESVDGRNQPYPTF